MLERDLYRQILGVDPPWQVTDVAFDRRPLRPESRNPLEHWEGEVTVTVEYPTEGPLCCPACGEECPGYDRRTRRWRHLDTCQYQTIVVCKVPRIRCTEHGVRQVEVPWAEPGSRFTALFETLAIAWLQEASLSAVSRLLRLSWDQVDGIMARAVRRGLARRAKAQPRHVAVDETSFQKRYVTFPRFGGHLTCVQRRPGVHRLGWKPNTRTPSAVPAGFLRLGAGSARPTAAGLPEPAGVCVCCCPSRSLSCPRWGRSEAESGCWTARSDRKDFRYTAQGPDGGEQLAR